MFELLEFGKRVLAESDLDRLLTAAIDGVIELCGAERGMILLFEPEGRAACSRRPATWPREDIERPEFEVSRTILEKVRADGRALLEPQRAGRPRAGRPRRACCGC